MIHWNWARDNLIRVRAPLDMAVLNAQGNGTPLVSATTATAKIFDREKDAFSTALAAAAATTITIGTVRASRLVVGDALEVVLDDGAVHAASVTATDVVTGVVTISTAIPAGRSVPIGNAVAVKLGPDVILSGYNLAGASATSSDWGYQGFASARHAGIRNGMKIRVETTLVEGAATGFDEFDAVVVGPGAAVP